MDTSLYKFPTLLANEALKAAKNADWCNQIPGLCLIEERQAIWVSEDLKGLFGERNAKGQTLLYCLLRFTKKDYIRNKFLNVATREQLEEQNTNCGSTALLGYFYGECENPRMEGYSPVYDVLFKGNNLLVAKIANKKGETALTFAMQIAKWRDTDIARLNATVWFDEK